MSDSLAISNSVIKPAGMREVLKIAWPLVVSLSINALMLFFERIFLSWHSTTSLQAVIPAFVLSFMFLCGFMALATYTGVFVSQHYGAKDYHGCSRVTFNGLIIAACSSVLILVCIPLGSWLLTVFEDNQVVIAEEQRFFQLVMVAQAILPFISAFEGFFNGIGRTRVTMRFSLARDVMRFVLDYLLIFGCCGLPELGIRGAGLSIIICYAAALGGLAWVYFSSKYHRQYHTRTELKWDFSLSRHVLRFAAPSAIQQVLDGASYALFVTILGKFNDLDQIVGNIAISLNDLSYIVFLGLGISASVLIGQYQGRHEPHLASRAAWNALRWGMLVSGVFSISLLLFPQLYLLIFAGEDGGINMAEALLIARPLLAVQALRCLFFACECITANSLKGAGDTPFVMIYSTVMALVNAAGNLVLVYVFHASIVTVWLWCSSGGLLLSAGYLWRLFVWRRWQGIDMLRRKQKVTPS